MYKKLEEVTQTNKKKIKLNEKITEKSTKAIIDPLFKSIPMHVDPSFQYEKVQKRHFRKPDLNKIEKIIEDCSNSSENIKKTSRILKKWQRFNSFDNKERFNFIDKDDLQIDNNAIIRYLVSTKKMKKLWKQNHFAFIAQIDRKLYSVKKDKKADNSFNTFIIKFY